MTDPCFSYIGPLIKRARISLKMTQEELAERINVSSRYIMAIENEGKLPSFEVFFQLIRTLGISSDTIIYPESASVPDEYEHFLHMYQTLSDRDKQILYCIMQKMHEA